MNKEDVLIALKEIHTRYCIPACEVNYTDKDYACMQYEKLVIHLSNQITQLTNQLKEFKEEHKIMKQILIENGLWERLLNDDRFLKYLKSDDNE